MIKIWNVDHYDHVATRLDSDGNEVQVITKCEMEKYMTTSQGTVKVVNPDTNGQVKPKRERDTKLIKKLLKKIGYTKPVTNLLDLWQFVLIDELGFTVTHEDIDKKLSAPAILGSVGGECKKCMMGIKPENIYWQDDADCECCDGDYTNCPNCKETEYRKSQLPANVTASAEWLKRNTHASPEEKAQAKRNGEVLEKYGRDDFDAFDMQIIGK